MSAIVTRNLLHQYKENFWSPPHEALKGLDLEVEPGESFGFLGVNGAGKTTTIKILVGLHRASGGSATLFGDPVEDPASRRHIGFRLNKFFVP